MYKNICLKLYIRRGLSFKQPTTPTKLQKIQGGKLMKKVQAKLAIIIAIAFFTILLLSTSAQPTLQTVR